MTTRNLSRLSVAACVVIGGLIAGTSLSGKPAVRSPRTRAERTNYLETSRYADVISFLDSLHGRPELSFGSIGLTSEGRDIPYVIASRPRVSTPQEARRVRRPIVYVQGNIHAGEVEGKEALLAMLRDLTATSRPNVLDSVILIAVPDYNADGNEKFASQEVNRGEQNGPALVGQRANGQGLDLNRDYIKAEAPETRASLAMFNKWDPDVFVDLHTTDGSFHGYALTYAPPLNPAAPLGAFTRDSIMPVLRQRMQARHGFATFDYGNFFSEDTLSKGWYTFDARPRFGTNYYGLRDRIAILSEAFSHDPFEKRIASTYAFIQEILSLAAERPSRFMMRRNPLPDTAATRLMRQPDSSVRGDGTGSRFFAWSEVTPGQKYALRTEMMAAPEQAGVIAELVERTRDSTRTQPGVPKGRRRTGKFVTVRMPVFDRFRTTLTTDTPLAYIIPATDTQVVRVLRTHGITVRGSDAYYRRRGKLQQFAIDSVTMSPRVFQRHRETTVTGHWHDYAGPTPKDFFLVNVEEVPRGRLSVYLLEPQSEDGLVTWNYFDAELRPASPFPVLRVIPAPN